MSPVRSGAGAFAVKRKPRGSRRGLGPRLAVAAVVLLLALAAGWWLTRAGLFQVARVETGSYRFTAAADLEAALARLLGRNIWLVAEDDALAALAGLPWLRDLRLARSLPSTLRVEFREWRPLLAVAPPRERADDPELLVLVADGRVLPFPEHLPAPGLPVLVGVPAPPDSTGCRRLAAADRDQVLALLAAVESTGLEAERPVDFVVARSGGFAIVLQDGQGALLVGRENFAARLQRYLVARDHLDDGLEVDLRFRDKITVRRP